MTANGHLHILHVIPGLTRERGGPTTCVQALARHQVQAGHQVTVLTTDQGARHGEQLAELAAGVALVSAAVRGPDRLAYTPGFTALIRRHIAASDVLHVHSIFTYPVHATLREALAAGVPVVLRPCGLLHRYSLRRSAWRKWVYRAAWGRMVRRAVAAWHYTSAAEAAESWPWEPRTHFILPNGVESEEYAVDRDEARRRVEQLWPQIGQSPYVLFLGRIHPKKRLDLLLRAFQAAAPQGVKLVVAGPDEGGVWRELAERHVSADPRVIRLDTVEGAEKVALLAGARLFALPSEHENFGIAALEALAAGTPALLSPHVDLGAEAAKAGLAHVVPLDANVWADRLARLLADPDGADQTVDSARAWVGCHYSWSRIAAELTERYHRVRADCLAGAPRVSAASSSWLAL
jgi:glycosyltransferase involved in cell wall biosynthesis